jgi:hypothetical protein
MDADDSVLSRAHQAVCTECPTSLRDMDDGNLHGARRSAAEAAIRPSSVESTISLSATETLSSQSCTKGSATKVRA